MVKDQDFVIWKFEIHDIFTWIFAWKSVETKKKRSKREKRKSSTGATVTVRCVACPTMAISPEVYLWSLLFRVVLELSCGQGHVCFSRFFSMAESWNVYLLRLSKRKGTKTIGVVESTTSIEVDQWIFVTYHMMNDCHNSQPHKCNYEEKNIQNYSSLVWGAVTQMVQTKKYESVGLKGRFREAGRWYAKRLKQPMTFRRPMCQILSNSTSELRFSGIPRVSARLVVGGWVVVLLLLLLTADCSSKRLRQTCIPWLGCFAMEMMWKMCRTHV